MSKYLLRALYAGLTMTALAACAVGPSYRPPDPGPGSAYVNAGATADSTAPGADVARFWRSFNDPVLTRLVEQALAANGDVRIAQARLRESRALLQGARAEALPEVDVGADATRSRSPGYLQEASPQGSRGSATVYEAGFTATWELDFFGRNHRASESAAALVDASAAGVASVWTSISAEVARTYLELRGLQQRQHVAGESIANQRQTLQLTERRLEFGRSTRLDAVRARSLLGSTEATLPALQAAIDRGAYRLATLTAQSPRAVLDQLNAGRADLPALPATDLAALPIGTPEHLLRRRPDLVRAERQLAAATANVGVATADLFPRISLTGLIGLSGLRLGALGESGSNQHSFSAGLTWPLLDFGRARARVTASEAQADQALAFYEQSVALALEETEGALSQFTHNAQQYERLEASAHDAEDASRLARLRFEAGSVDFLVVLDAQRQALATRDALVQSQAGQAAALVAIYRALGGGWIPEPATIASQ